MTADSGRKGPSPRRLTTAEAAQYAPVGFATLSSASQTVEAYVAFLHRSALSDETIRAYTTKTRSFAAWLDAHTEHDPAEVFTDPMSRDFALRDWRTHLLHRAGLSPGSVDSYLSAVNGLLAWVGVGSCTVSRVQVDGTAQYAHRMTPEQFRALMRAAQRRGPRDLAIIALMRLNGLRIAEVHRTNVDDFAITARTGPLMVRGKGDKTRVVHMGKPMRDVLTAWVADRRTWPGAGDNPALFLAERGGRLAVRSLREVVYQVAKDAGIDSLTPHQLRHQFAHGFLDSGGLVTELQEVLGHASLATTAIYARPTEEEKAASTERATPGW